MGRYVIRRLLWTVLVMLLVTLVTFAIFFLMPPGNPAIKFAGKQPTPEIIAEVEKQLGLDKPAFGITLPKVWESEPWDSQYSAFLGRLVTGDSAECPPGIGGCGWPGLGVSYDSRTAVREEIIERAPRTIVLAIGASIIWLVVGVSIGVLSALRRRTFADRAAHGIRALRHLRAGLRPRPRRSLHLPVEARLRRDGDGLCPVQREPVRVVHATSSCRGSCLALLYAAFYARMTRGNLIDVMGEDYIRTARAKGLSERKVVFKHGLRASLTPIVDDVRDGPRAPDRRRGHHRDGLQHPGARQLGRRLGRRRRPTGDHGGRPGRRRSPSRS